MPDARLERTRRAYKPTAIELLDSPEWWDKEYERITGYPPALSTREHWNVIEAEEHGGEPHD